MGIRLILIIGTLLVFFATIRNRTLIRERMIGAGLMLLVIIAVLFPELTTEIANLLSVGRGADLVFYLSFLLFAYVCAVLFSKQRLQERRLTKLARHISIRTARPPKKRQG